MILQYSDDKLVTFEKTTGMTGIFTGNELQLIKNYAKCGEQTPFIDRLYDLGIFCGNASRELHGQLDIPQKPAPYALHIDTTTFCPLHCPQCYKGDTGDTFLAWDRYQALIAEAEQLHIFQIALGGGEPLCHPRIVDMVQAVAGTEMAISITTSGSGLTGERLTDLTHAGLNHIQISLNGSTEAVHSYSRDGFDEAIAALELLSGKGISFGVNWVARRDNLDDFPAVVSYVKSLGADNINVLRYKPSPVESYEKAALNREEFYRLAAMIKQVRGLTVKTDSAYSNLLVYLNHGRVSANSCGCGAGRTFAAVTAEGQFKPCSHLQLTHTAGSLGDYLESRELREFLTARVQTQDCGVCSYQNVCGGCRAICHNVTGDLFAGETDCPAFKART